MYIYKISLIFYSIINFVNFTIYNLFDSTNFYEHISRDVQAKYHYICIITFIIKDYSIRYSYKRDFPTSLFIFEYEIKKKKKMNKTNGLKYLQLGPVVHVFRVLYHLIVGQMLERFLSGQAHHFPQSDGERPDAARASVPVLYSRKPCSSLSTRHYYS